MANVKKMIAFVIAICSFYCTFAFSITKAQTLDDVLDTIPVVEFVPATKEASNNGYDDAKVISISRELARSTSTEQVKSLIRQDDVVFFKDMNADEVSALIDEPTLLDDGSNGDNETDNGTVVGTGVTITGSVYHFIECAVANAETYDEVCEECGQVPEPISSSRLSVVEDDYLDAARSAYAITKMKGFNDFAHFPDGAKAAFTESVTIKNFGFKVGMLYCNVYVYPKNRMNINGATKRVYDCLASYCAAPSNNPKVLRIEGYLGYKDSAYAILERTRLPSSKPKTTVELSLSAGTSNIGASFKTQWTFDTEAFQCTNQFSDPKLAGWIYKTSDPIKGDARGLAPGVRMYTANNVKAMQVRFKVTGVLNNCFVFHAKKTLDFTRKLPF